MSLGISSYTYAWNIGIPGSPLPVQPMNALGLVQRAADLNVAVVQIADNLPLHRLDASQLDALYTLADVNRTQIEVGTRGVDPDHLRRYLEIARQFASPIVRVVVDTADQHPTPTEVIGALRVILPEFEKAGIILAIENHDRFKTHTLIDILTQANSSHIGICLDTVNSFGAGEGPEVVVAALAPYVVNLHVKDFVIRRHPSMLGFEVQGTPAGDGMLDVPWLFQQIRRLNSYDFNAILELWTPPEATIEESIQKEDRWATRSVQYLKTLIADLS